MAAAETILVDVPMPQMGASVAEGTVIEWNRAVGDTVEANETLCEISTDKVDSELPAPVGGTLVEILVEAGETVDVGTSLARIRASAGDATPVAPAPPAQAVPSVDRATRRRYSPVVRRMAEAKGLDLTQIVGTGRDGRVTKRDVLAHTENAPEASALQSAALESAPMSLMRRTIAKHMRQSLATAAHCHTWIEADMTGVEAARAAAGLTALPFVARATTRALVAHPPVNAWLDGDSRVLHRDVNLGIAVSLGEDGLIVPVIHGAQGLSTEALASRIRDLARRARRGELDPAEVQGGTFTITNPGRHGTLMAAPIINQPQVAILDLEAIAKRPVVIRDQRGDDAVGIRATTVLGLAWDHRALDGELAAEFLATVRDDLERDRLLTRFGALFIMRAVARKVNAGSAVADGACPAERIRPPSR